MSEFVGYNRALQNTGEGERLPIISTLQSTQKSRIGYLSTDTISHNSIISTAYKATNESSRHQYNTYDHIELQYGN